jgi:metallo-beta-lactamase class B
MSTRIESGETHMIRQPEHINKLIKTFFLLLFGLFNIAGQGQVYHDTIKISKDLELLKISDNAYVHISYANLPEYGRISANGLIFINNKTAYLFDTPWTDSLTRTLVTFLESNMKLKIAGFVPNHWHNDCMGGLGYLQSRMIDSYANQMTIDIARSKKLPVPAHGFKDSLQLFLGEKVIDCYYLGAAHSLDNIIIWIPSEKILFPGCMIKSLSSVDLGNIADGDMNSYPKTIDKLILKFRNAKIVIPGHGQPGNSDLLMHTRDLLKK